MAHEHLLENNLMCSARLPFAQRHADESECRRSHWGLCDKAKSGDSRRSTSGSSGRTRDRAAEEKRSKTVKSTHNKIDKNEYGRINYTMTHLFLVKLMPFISCHFISSFSASAARFVVSLRLAGRPICLQRTRAASRPPFARFVLIYNSKMSSSNVLPFLPIQRFLAPVVSPLHFPCKSFATFLEGLAQRPNWTRQWCARAISVHQNHWFVDLLSWWGLIKLWTQEEQTNFN